LNKYFLTILLCISLAISALAQTRQQALDEIARIEKMPEILRQAWEAGRTQTDTIIDTPYGKLTIKFNLDELIQDKYTPSINFEYTQNELLRYWNGVQAGNEIRINNGGSLKNSTYEGMKATITHELGHYMMNKIKQTPLSSPDKYRTVEDESEIEADAFAMRYIGKTVYTNGLKQYSSSQSYIDAVTNRMEEMEREERETLARLYTIANAPPAAPPPPPAPKPSVNPAQALADSAIAAFGRKDYDKAIADYTQAIRIDPKFATAYSNRGSAHGMKGEYDKAIADYSKAIELNPGIMYLYLNRGSAYFDKGDYDMAMADYNLQLRIDPNLAYAYTGRGNVYQKRNDLDRAMIEHNRAILLDPNFAVAYLNRGVVYDEKGDLDHAIADFNQAIQLDPNSAEAYTNRGIVYQKKGDADKAMADFNQAIRLNPNYALAYTRLAMEYFKKDDMDRTIAEYNHVIRLKPNDAEGYKLRGMAYYKKDDFDHTIADFEKALQLNPNDSDVRKVLDIVRQLKQMKK